MALRAKVRGQWRTVSAAMARRFRARGVYVEDTNAPQPVVDRDLKPDNVPAPALAPTDPVPTGAAVLDVLVSAAMNEPRKCSLCGELGHAKAKCPLAELDALTAPES